MISLNTKLIFLKIFLIFIGSYRLTHGIEISMSFTTHRPSSIRLHLEGISEIDPIQPSLTLKPQMIDEEIQCDILDSKDIFPTRTLSQKDEEVSTSRDENFYAEKPPSYKKSRCSWALQYIPLFVKILKGLEILMKMKFY